MELLDEGRGPEVVLVLLGGHVVSGEYVLLEHELLGVLLALAHDALVGAAVRPVVLPHLDGSRGAQCLLYHRWGLAHFRDYQLCIGGIRVG